MLDHPYKKSMCPPLSKSVLFALSGQSERINVTNASRLSWAAGSKLSRMKAKKRHGVSVRGAVC